MSPAPTTLPFEAIARKGPQGPKGDTGAAGAPGVSAYEIVHWTASPLNVGDLGHVQVECPAGKKALGGGLSSGQPVALILSAPMTDGTVWYVNFKNVGVQPTSVAAFAICAQVG